ncbi:MAG: hypothetical protein JOZ67_00465 [Gammaproteobacteria bacterium]|nr:hypothetical protein [Gammaproteobacteria bacterium]MBV9695559.1 hypothetical protein [Gammaproteobacteria bacterium]
MEKTGIARLLRPATEPLEAIAGVMRAHWRSAARTTGQLFTPVARPWLRVERLAVPVAVAEPHHFASGGRLIR